MIQLEHEGFSCPKLWTAVGVQEAVHYGIYYTRSMQYGIYYTVRTFDPPTQHATKIVLDPSSGELILRDLLIKLRDRLILSLEPSRPNFFRLQ